MGIKNLNKLLTNKCSWIFRQKQCDEFSGKTIAIDTSLFVCMYLARGSLDDSMVEFIVTLLEKKIKPIFVMDGESPPEKMRERRLRSERKRHMYERVAKLEGDLEEYKASGHVSSALSDINRKFASRLCPDRFDVRRVAEHVAKLRSQIISVKDGDFERIKNMANAFGIPVIQAKGEAEFTCARMARDGIVDAVFTRDTDVLACLAPVVITKLDRNVLTCIDVVDILDALDLDAKSFLDMCILCGTDFNPNIPHVAIFKAYALIKAYGSIEEISKRTNLDVSPLNFERTREIFSTDNDDNALNESELELIRTFDRTVYYDNLVKAIPEKLSYKIVYYVDRLPDIIRRSGGVEKEEEESPGDLVDG